MKKPFINLDTLISESVKFQFKGEQFTIKPISIEAFMRFNNAWYELADAISKKKIDDDASLNLAVSIIKSVCDDLPEERIRNEMSIVQIGALVQLVVDTVTARGTDDDEMKKKVQKMRELIRPAI